MGPLFGVNFNTFQRPCWCMYRYRLIADMGVLSRAQQPAPKALDELVGTWERHSIVYRYRCVTVINLLLLGSGLSRSGFYFGLYLVPGPGCLAPASLPPPAATSALRSFPDSTPQSQLLHPDEPRHCSIAPHTSTSSNPRAIRPFLPQASLFPLRAKHRHWCRRYCT